MSRQISALNAHQQHAQELRDKASDLVLPSLDHLHQTAPQDKLRRAAWWGALQRAAAGAAIKAAVEAHDDGHGWRTISLATGLGELSLQEKARSMPGYKPRKAGTRPPVKLADD